MRASFPRRAAARGWAYEKAASVSGFLAVEPLILARLADTVAVPGIKFLGAPDLDGLHERSQPVPAVHVIFAGFDRLEAAQGVIEVVETWLTVVVVRNVRDAQQGAGSRADAGAIMDAVFAALNGWQPAGYRPLTPAVPPLSGYTDGFGYHPLAWRVHRRAPLPCQEFS